MEVSTKTYRQVIQELSKYFLTQDPKIMARILANAMIDLQRITMWGELSDMEKMSVCARTQENMKSLDDFVKNGPPKGDIKVYNMEEHFEEEDETKS